jgi:ABC-2 type transport system permease protein
VSAPDVLVRTNEPPRFRLLARIRELWRHREILANLARKELRVKYKSTVLGMVWSMLHPLLYLVVFYVVFTYFLPSGIPDFPVYLLSGLLPWTLFSAALGGATASVTGNAQLVPKVAFPREVLPLAVIRAQTVNFFFQFVVLVAFLVVFGYPLFHRGVILLPLALVVLLVFAAAVGFATAALNVRYRDVTYLVELALLAWFWATPIVYPASLVSGNLGHTGFTIYLLNPLANIVLTFQRAIYGGVSSEALGELPAPGLRWYGFRALAVGAVSAALLYVTWRLFFRRSGDFAEEM